MLTQTTRAPVRWTSRAIDDALSRGCEFLIHGPIKRYRAWRRRRDAIRQLSMLDDHMLRDIGLRRSQIGAVVADLDKSQAMADKPRKAANDDRPDTAKGELPKAA